MTRQRRSRKSVERIILETLAFFELFGVGVSVDTLADCIGSRGLDDALNRLVERGRIDRVRSIVGLSRESIERQRARSLISSEKRTLARQFMVRIGLVPYIRFVGLGNSVAFGSATELSDLDCFVVAASNRLWTARFLLLVRAKWLGLTKRAGASADRLDFGWWVDESVLDLALRAIDDDVHLRYWLACLIPLMDRASTYERLLATNLGLLHFFLQTRFESGNHKHGLISKVRKSYHQSSLIAHASTSPLEWLLDGRLGDGFEWLLFTIQRAKIWAEPLAWRPGADVVITCHECKLHHLDERATLRDRWRVLIKKN